MSISHDVFTLKPSRYAWFFQLGMAFIFLCCSFQVLSWWGWGIIAFLLIMSGWFYHKVYPRLYHFAYLGEMEWTFSFVGHAKIHHCKLKQIIDHQFYIVLYWDSTYKPTVIWRDQLDLNAWKRLKVLALLHTPTLKLE